MTSSDATLPLAAAATRNAPGPVDRLARRLVHGRLRRLEHGRVVIGDDETRVAFGRAAGHAALDAAIVVHHPRFYRRALLGGSLGAADAWIDGDWWSDDLVSLLRLFVRNVELSDDLESGPAALAGAAARLVHRVRRNTRRGSRRNIAAHYDLGNEFFALWLDETMTYSCGVFPSPGASMAEASEAKLDRICRALELRPDHHVLEIGGGWGSFALHAASRYGCRVTTTTISRQHEVATRRVAEAGLGDRVTVLLRDYRDLEGRFDAVVSIEMIEAVGHEHLETYFRIATERLVEGGRMMLQAIVMPDERYARYLRSADFIRTHVFPGSSVPSLGAMETAMRRAGDLRPVAVEEITGHYVTTLQRWRHAFLQHLDEVRGLGYPERFIRLWSWYLCYCEAGFAERYIGTVQMLLAREGRGSAPAAAPGPSEAVGP